METKYIDVKGIKTRYLEAGTGEPLLLVHGGDFGWYCSANDWDLNIDSFVESFHVFAIDRIGCGFTENPKRDDGYVIGAAVQHAYDFMKTMKIDSAHVAGHSRGGYIVCRLAMEHPESVKSLIIVDSGTLMTSSNQMITSYQSMGTIYDEWDRLSALITDVRDRYRYLEAANSFKSEHVTENLVDMMVQIVELPKSKEAVAKMEGGLKSQYMDDLEAKRKETHDWIKGGGIRVPTLIIWGFNDPSAIFDPIGLDTLRLIFPTTPQSQMHILNQAGHNCFRDQPEAFVAAVTSFIKSSSQVL